MEEENTRTRKKGQIIWPLFIQMFQSALTLQHCKYLPHSPTILKWSLDFRQRQREDSLTYEPSSLGTTHIPSDNQGYKRLPTLERRHDVCKRFLWVEVWLKN